MFALGVNKHAVAGFQLTQSLGVDKAKSRLTDVRLKWEEIRAKEPQSIHVELVTFSNREIYEHFVKNLILNADSLGTNEQEMQTLHSYLKHNVTLNTYLNYIVFFYRVKSISNRQ